MLPFAKVAVNQAFGLAWRDIGHLVANCRSRTRARKNANVLVYLGPAAQTQLLFGNDNKKDIFESFWIKKDNFLSKNIFASVFE